MLAPLVRAGWRWSGSGIVLFGHGLTAGPAADFVSRRSLHIDPREFEEMVADCRALGAEFISLAALLDRAERGFPRGRPWIHLTFDDGYASDATILHPILRARGIPWSLFVSAHHAATGERFPDHVLRCAIAHARGTIDLPGGGPPLAAGASAGEREEYFRRLRHKERGRGELLDLVGRARALVDPAEWRRLEALYPDDAPITAAQVRALAADPLVAIGSHCHRHVILNARVTEAEAAAELAESRRWIAAATGAEPIAFSYPNGERGDFSPATRRLCAAAGYRLAFTTVPGAVRPGTDPWEIPRRALAPTAAKMRAKLARTILRSIGGKR